MSTSSRRSTPNINVIINRKCCPSLILTLRNAFISFLFTHNISPGFLMFYDVDIMLTNHSYREVWNVVGIFLSCVIN